VSLRSYRSEPQARSCLSSAASSCRAGRIGGAVPVRIRRAASVERSAQALHRNVLAAAPPRSYTPIGKLGASSQVRPEPEGERPVRRLALLHRAWQGRRLDHHSIPGDAGLAWQAVLRR